MFVARLKPAGRLILLLLGPLSVSLTAQSLDDVLLRVSRNVQEFRNSIPDFLCSERLTSRAVDKNGKVTRQIVVESTFTVRQSSAGKGPAFLESRDVFAIDGKSAKSGTQFPKIPFQYGGGFASVLLMTFLPDNLNFQTYRL